MPAGRPTQFYPEIAEELISYFRDNPDKEDMPTVTMFALKKGLTRQTLHDWATKTVKKGKEEVLKYPEFSYAYKMAVEYQENYLVKGALTNKFNATFSIFFAKNRLGYTDRKELDATHTGSMEISTITRKVVDPEKQKQ